VVGGVLPNCKIVLCHFGYHQTSEHWDFHGLVLLIYPWAHLLRRNIKFLSSTLWCKIKMVKTDSKNPTIKSLPEYAKRRETEINGSQHHLSTLYPVQRGTVEILCLHPGYFTIVFARTHNPTEEAWPSLHPTPPLYISHQGSYCYLSATSNWLLPLYHSA